jgi:hypothetical protein
MKCFNMSNLAALFAIGLAALLPIVAVASQDCYTNANSSCWVEVSGTWQGTSACNQAVGSAPLNFCKQICSSDGYPDPGCCSYTTQIVTFSSIQTGCPCAGSSPTYTIFANMFTGLACKVAGIATACEAAGPNGTCS